MDGLYVIGTETFVKTSCKNCGYDFFEPIKTLRWTFAANGKATAELDCHMPDCKKENIIVVPAVLYAQI